MFNRSITRIIPFTKQFKRSYTLKQLTNVGKMGNLKDVNSLYYKMFGNQFLYKIRIIDNQQKSPIYETQLEQEQKVLERYVKYHTLFFNLPQEFKQNNLHLIKELNELCNKTKKQIEILSKLTDELKTIKQIRDDIDYLMEEDEF